MELLLQLSSIKGAGKIKMSLLEFIIHSIRKNNPSILKFTSDLVSCELASKIDVSFLAGKVQDLEKGIVKIKKEIKKAEDQILAYKEDIEKLNSEGDSEENQSNKASLNEKME